MSSNEFEKHDSERVECWSCYSSLDEHVPDIVFPVCQGCWRSIPIEKRLWLQLFTRTTDEGGMGLRELFEAGLKDLDLVKAFGHRPGSVN